MLYQSNVAMPISKVYPECQNSVMLKLYFAPRTRSVRIVWLLEELGLPYELIRAEFVPPESNFFSQSTPLGKFPTLEDRELVMCESGAIRVSGRCNARIRARRAMRLLRR
jgi:hypothetical protein